MGPRHTARLLLVIEFAVDLGPRASTVVYRGNAATASGDAVRSV